MEEITPRTWAEGVEPTPRQLADWLADETEGWASYHAEQERHAETRKEAERHKETLARVEADRDALLLLAQEAIQAHRDLHRLYGNTSACGGGIGGAAMTQHCGVTCGYFEKHEADNNRWYRVESAYFRRQDGDPEWGAALRGPSDTEGQA